MSKKLKSFSKTLFALVLVITLAISLRLFVFEIYAIPSSSMEDTLFPGDKIVVCKLAYGPVLPRSPFEIPWVNLLFLLNKKWRTDMDSTWWQYRRIKGFAKPRHNDVMVFLHPDTKEVFIKRCAGLPGDTFSIKNSRLFAGSTEIAPPSFLKHNYRIWFKKGYSQTDILPKNNISIYQPFPGENYYQGQMNCKQTESLIKQDITDSIKINISVYDTLTTVFPYSRQFSWTIDNFGPLEIPFKGMKISFAQENMIKYWNVIRDSEKKTITGSDGKSLVDGVETETFTFTKDYYFMLGDNRHNSADSRYFGYVPEEKIIGKAVLVLFNYHEGKFGWERFMKKIR